MEVEYGGSARFLNPASVRMVDGNGNEILCKCGKSAGAGAFGKEAFVAWCTDCSPMHKKAAKFVYKPPKE